MALCSFQNGNFENPVQETRIYGLPPRFQDVGCHFAGSPCNIEFLKKKKKCYWKVLIGAITRLRFESAHLLKKEKDHANGSDILIL